MFRLLLAFFTSATTALAIVMIVAAVFAPQMSVKPWEAALHFGEPAALIIFSVAFVLGVPLYCIASFFNLVSWGRVIGGGVLLALVYPALVWIYSDFGVVSWWGFIAFGAIGAVAALVFCEVAGIHRAAK